MKFLSLFSGIEAASVAWHSLGWKCVGVAEVEPFPMAVLRHHYPEVPNLGDVTADDFLHRASALLPDIIVGGSPCQSFSVAGLRKSLNDDRGNLALRYIQIVKAVDDARTRAGLRPPIVVYENVGGLLSTPDNAFGCFLAGLCGASDPLVPPGKSGKPGKWPDAGVVAGPERWAAWRIIDAQGFDPQRRRRVFVVSTRAADRLGPGRVLFEAEADLERYLGDRASTGPLFPVRESLRGDLASGRETGKSVAGSLAARTRGGGGLGTDFDLDGGLLVDHGRNAGGVLDSGRAPVLGGLQETVAFQGGNVSRGAGAVPNNDVFPTLNANHGRGVSDQHPCVAVITSKAFGGATKGGINVPTTLTAHPSRIDFETETFVIANVYGRYDAANTGPSLRAKGGGDAAPDVAPTMRAMGRSGSRANASGHPAVCITGDVTHALKAEGFDASEDGTGIGGEDDPMFTLQAGKQRGVCIAGAPVVALRGHEDGAPNADAPGAANANGAGIGRDGDPCLTLDCDGSAAVAFQASQSGMRLGDGTHPTLDSNNGSRRHHGALIGSAVRRLTPGECESLQNFPRGYTAIPWKKHGPEDCPDGPRYKALGNSMNCAVMNWIGRRIAMVEAEHNTAQDLFGNLPTQANDAISLFDI